jgi:2-pyrone-4,6-dicarboxylate lactonase
MARGPSVCLPPHKPQLPTQVKLPVGAIDCHCHLYGDPVAYPLSNTRSYTPVTSPLEDYMQVCGVLGITRTVQVNASVYGHQNQITLDAIAALGQHRARGVAGVPLDVGTEALERLHMGGIRGVRLSTHVAGYGGTAHMERLAPKLQPLGWHLQVHVAHIDELATLEDLLMRLPCPLVFDHLGCARGADGVGALGFQALLRLLSRRDDCWVKVSSWYRRSDQPAPHNDMKPLVQSLVDTRSNRLVFGTNWPHPALFPPDVVPSDADLLVALLDWVPDPIVREQLFVRNPEILYGFPPQ